MRAGRRSRTRKSTLKKKGGRRGRVKMIRTRRLRKPRKDGLRRTSKHHRGGFSHPSFSDKWLSPESTASEMSKHNPVQIKKPGQKGEMNIVLYTTNHLADGKKSILYRSDGACVIQEVKHVPLIEGKVTYVVWVRHCHSCSNAAGEGISAVTNPMLKMREPLCTALGARQALDAGVYLDKLLKDFSSSQQLDGSCCVSFYSSFLPRTFQTAKLLAASYDKVAATDAKCGSSERSIRRICNVSEETKPYEKYAGKVRSSSKGSQSTTTIAKSNCHAKYLNDNMPSLDFTVDTTPDEGEQPCGGTIIAGSSIDKLACDYSSFLTDTLPTLQSTGSGDCTTPFNVIVSHGGYIRHCVLQSTEKHPANTQMFLVKYTRPDDPELPMHAEILKTIPIPGMEDFNNADSLPVHDPSLYESAKNVNTSCSYSFNKDICPSTKVADTPQPMFGQPAV